MGSAQRQGRVGVRSRCRRKPPVDAGEPRGEDSRAISRWARKAPRSRLACSVLVYGSLQRLDLSLAKLLRFARLQTLLTQLWLTHEVFLGFSDLDVKLLARYDVGQDEVPLFVRAGQLAFLQGEAVQFRNDSAAGVYRDLCTGEWYAAFF